MLVQFSVAIGMVVLIASLALAVFKRAWAQPMLFILMVYGLVSLLCDSASIVSVLYFGKSSQPIILFWVLFELICLSFFFYKSLPKYRTAILVISSIVLMFSLYNTLLIQSAEPLAWRSNAMIGLTLAFYSLLGFYDLFEDQESIYISSIPRFWAYTAILSYFCGSLFTVLLSSKILSVEVSILKGLWYVHNVFLIMKNLLLLIAFSKYRAHG